MASIPPLVSVDCIREFDPPHVRITILATGATYDVPTDFYQQLQLAVPGLPANPCA